MKPPRKPDPAGSREFQPTEFLREKNRFSESQIVAILKEVELGAKVGETCRKHGVSEPTYYKWKSQYSGMTVPHLAQLRELQDENARLKRMYADLALMHSALKDVVNRKL